MLRARSHEVFTPTLTGQGERAHVRPDGIATHVDDILAVLKYEDLHDVHLVLHGYAGMLAGPIADATDRLASITYLGAFLPEPGECLLDLTFAEELADDLGITDPVHRQWAQPRLTDFPLVCGAEPVTFDPRTLAKLPQAYVRHTQPAWMSLHLSWERADTMTRQEISCGHAMMIAAPRQVARLVETFGPRDGLPPVFPASPRIALW